MTPHETFKPAEDQGLSARVLFLIFLSASVVRLLNLYFIPDIAAHAMIEDSPIYWAGAAHWMESGFFSRPGDTGYVHETERVPLYFLYLIPFRALFGETLVPVLISQALLDGATCVIIACFGQMISRTVGLASGMLAAVWPNLIIHSGLVLTDTLFLFFFSLVLLFAARFLSRGRLRDAAVAGLFCGLAIMTRPVALYLPFAMILVAPFVAYRHNGNRTRSALAAVIVLVTAALPVLPIAVRNINHFDTLQLTSVTGTHIQGWIAGYSRGLQDGKSFNESSRQMNEKFRDILKAEDVDPASLNQFQISTRQGEHARAELAELPLTVVAGAWFQGMMLNTLAPALLIEPRVRALNKGSFIDTTGGSFVDRIGNFLTANSSGYVAWALFGALTGGIAMLLQFAGWIQLYRWQPYAALFATLVILYFLLVNGPVASPKYRLPFEPVLILFQAIAITWLARRWRSAK